MRKCKSKDCNTMLEDNYKKKYCEKCLNNRAGVFKKSLKIGGTVIGVFSLAAELFFRRKR